MNFAFQSAFTLSTGYLFPALAPVYSCLDRAQYEGTLGTQEVAGASQVWGLRSSVYFIFQRIQNREQNSQLHGSDLSYGEKWH